MKPLSCLLLVFALLGCTNAGAQNYYYLDCQWFIPSNFVEVEPGLYREKFEPDNPQWNMATILFTSFSSEEVTSSSDGSQKTLALKHPGETGIQYYSSFTWNGHKDDALWVQELMLVNGDKAVSLFGLTEAESLALTANCADPVTINQHFKIVHQVSKGFEKFLATEHGFTVL